MNPLLLVPIFVQVVFSANRLAYLSTVHDYLNICLDGRHHKSEPGPEDAMFQQCTPWKKRSCCTSEVSKDLHLSENWLNFDWNHCGWLSPQCRRHFLQDLCFYECSPNVGPWLVLDNKKIRNERFMHVPMCRSECDAWWEDCKNETTCLKNWSKGFNWTTGVNTCPEGKPCRPFHEIYRDSTTFCEGLWGESWKVMEKGQPCMYLWFSEEGDNPNDAIAKKQAEKLLGINGASQQDTFVLLTLLCSLCSWLFLSC
ncbi:folate receptor gamma-like [Haliotis rubra]|uniref:folate receptor gamma-like n=1 Tax=Haliotis rubra TaxID=36100 RepID=UPI001EE55D6A|nr:folate receptor gamma-like [Haliotis rubra]XP_046563852.1 folate receptor gamma-like [Haliotis rubra]